MIVQTKEEYLKERIKFDLDQALRLGHSLGFSKSQILLLFNEVANDSNNVH